MAYSKKVVEHYENPRCRPAPGPGEASDVASPTICLLRHDVEQTVCADSHDGVKVRARMAS